MHPKAFKSRKKVQTWLKENWLSKPIIACAFELMRMGYKCCIPLIRGCTQRDQCIYKVNLSRIMCKKRCAYIARSKYRTLLISIVFNKPSGNDPEKIALASNKNKSEEFRYRRQLKLRQKILKISFLGFGRIMTILHHQTSRYRRG